MSLLFRNHVIRKSKAPYGSFGRQKMKIINVQEGSDDITSWGNSFSSSKTKAEKENTCRNEENGNFRI